MKTIKNVLITVFFTALILSCNKNDDGSNSIVLQANAELSVTNQMGEDLLDPNNPNAYRTEDIEIFHEINGQVEPVFDAMSSYPKGFFVYEHESEYRIRVFLNITKEDPFPITYVKWNSTDTDTLKAKFEYKSSGVYLKKIWLNGNLNTPEYSYYFDIVK